MSTKVSFYMTFVALSNLLFDIFVNQKSRINYLFKNDNFHFIVLVKVFSNVISGYLILLMMIHLLKGIQGLEHPMKNIDLQQKLQEKLSKFIFFVSQIISSFFFTVLKTQYNFTFRHPYFRNSKDYKEKCLKSNVRIAPALGTTSRSPVLSEKRQTRNRSRSSSQSSQDTPPKTSKIEKVSSEVIFKTRRSSRQLNTSSEETSSPNISSSSIKCKKLEKEIITQSSSRTRNKNVTPTSSSVSESSSERSKRSSLRSSQR